MLALERFKYTVSLFLVKLVYCVIPRVSHDVAKHFDIVIVIAVL